MGLRFRNRVGVGAGFDKDGVGIRGWAALGFGFVELGTVTPRPQSGNPRPRLFRLPADEALINRMGFNNAGADALAARIAEAKPHLPPGFVVGVNIGRNRDGDVDDYPAAARAVAGVADYLAVNVSSPNTPRLRDLEDPERLPELLATVRDAAPSRPLVVKLSPDLTHNRRADIIRALPGAADGVIVSNTTTVRVGHRSRSAMREAGCRARRFDRAARRDGGGAEDRRGSPRDHRVRGPGLSGRRTSGGRCGCRPRPALDRDDLRRPRPHRAGDSQYAPARLTVPARMARV